LAKPWLLLALALVVMGTAMIWLNSTQLAALSQLQLIPELSHVRKNRLNFEALKVMYKVIYGCRLYVTDRGPGVSVEKSKHLHHPAQEQQ
jgi:hypothetical protein